MTIRYDIDLKKNVIFMAAYGAIGVADIAQAIEELESSVESAKPMTMVIELREIKRAFFVREMDRLITLLSNEAGRFVSCFAFIVSRDTMMGVGKKFAIRAARKGLKLEVFNDYADAAKWLRMVA